MKCACAQGLAPVLQGAYDDLRGLEAQCAQHAEGEHTMRCATVTFTFPVLVSAMLAWTPCAALAGCSAEAASCP
jgi:hypothetical protein